jgi:ABC-type branched-subunit amino acid transport system ATPase component
MSACVLKADHVAKHFGGVKVLNDVNFELEKGEKLALIGPNGAGKTTLLNLIGGQLPLSGGKVLLEDKDISHLPPNKRLHRGIGRSYQVNNLFFDMNIMDNVLLALYGAERTHLGMWSKLERRKDYVDQAGQLLETVGMYEKRYDSLHVLSYGDQRLIELALAYTGKPKVVLLDEPSAGLPTAEAFAFANVIRKLSSECSLVFCAHDMDLVFNLADSIMVLNFGEIIAKGLPEEIQANEEVQACYLGVEEAC